MLRRISVPSGRSSLIQAPTNGLLDASTEDVVATAPHAIEAAQIAAPITLFVAALFGIAHLRVVFRSERSLRTRVAARGHESTTT
jgi:hypothetical protein